MDRLEFHRRSLVLLLLLALGVRLILFYGGVRGSDAYAYAQHAMNLATGHYDVTTDSQYYGFRFTVLLPTALAYTLFGPHDSSSALFPLLASLGTLWLIVALGTRWFDDRTGLLAGLLYSVFPLDLPGASLLGPDSFLPLLSVAAVMSFLKAGSAAYPAAWYFGTGLCVGLSTQAREIGLLLLLPLALFAMQLKDNRRGASLLMIGMGFLAPLALEAAAYWLLTGDPLYRMTVIQQLSEPYAGGTDPEGEVSWWYYPRAMFGLDLGGFAWFGFFVYLALGATVLAFARNEGHRIAPVLLWIVPVFAYLEFGSMSVSRYLPILKAYHYLTLISVPIVLLGAYGLTTLWTMAMECGSRGVWQRAGVALMLVGLAATSLYGTYRVRENIRDDARPYQVVAQFVQAHPERVIYVPHERWALFLNYYLGYQTGYRFYQHPPRVGAGRLRYLWEVGEPSSLPLAYVVVHDRYLYFDTKGRTMGRVPWLPDYVFNPPTWWRVLVEERQEPAYNSFVLYETGGARTIGGGSS